MQVQGLLSPATHQGIGASGGTLWLADAAALLGEVDGPFRHEASVSNVKNSKSYVWKCCLYILNNPEKAELIMQFYILFTPTKLIEKKMHGTVA